MNVRSLCLAILNFGDATGYQIRKLSFEGEYSYFVDASYGSIYPALAKLELDELVIGREEIHPGKPARKVYSITDAGRAEFREALKSLPQKDSFKSEFLLIAICAPMMQRSDLTAAIEHRIIQLENELTLIRCACNEFNNPAGSWTSKYGEMCVTASLDYLTEHRYELESMAIQPEIHTQIAPQAAE